MSNIDPDLSEKLVPSISVKCRYCGAEPGQPCIGNIPTHRARSDAANKKALKLHKNGNRGSGNELFDAIQRDGFVVAEFKEDA